MQSTSLHWSEYLQQLSSVAKHRYKEKVLLAGLKTDPYCIEECDWEKSPELLPALSWSDVMVYMISTPSPYTGEAVKVPKIRKFTNYKNYRHGRGCWIH